MQLQTIAEYMRARGESSRAIHRESIGYEPHRLACDPATEFRLWSESLRSAGVILAVPDPVRLPPETYDSLVDAWDSGFYGEDD